MAESELGELFPIGIIHCTMEKYPRVLSLNETMKHFLNMNQADDHWLGLVENNFYYLIPHEDRKNMDAWLNETYESGQAVAIDHSLICSEGKRKRFSGWVRMWEKHGVKEYLFMYCEARGRYSSEIGSRAYLSALESAYNIIFMADLRQGIVKCIHGKDTSPIGNTYYADMTIESAIVYWCDGFVHEEDRKITRDFFTRISTAGFLQAENRPMQAEFRIIMPDGRQYYYLAVAILMDEDHVMICCRDTTSVLYSAHPDRERQHIFIRTFGYFDIFVDGKPVFFSNAKEKELLALLVDRNGGTLSGQQAISYLWPELPADEKTLARYRKLAMNMCKSLEKCSIQNIVANSHGIRHLLTEQVECDYYGFLRGEEKYVKAFNESYMSDYSWAEETLGNLLKLSDY